MAKTEAAPTQAAPKKAGLDRKVKHLGTYANFRKQEFPAYLVWTDDGEKKRGFRLLSAKDHREFRPGLLILKLEDLKPLKVDFVASGKTEALGEKDAAVIAAIEDAEAAREQAIADHDAKLEAARKKMTAQEDGTARN